MISTGQESKEIVTDSMDALAADTIQGVRPVAFLPGFRQPAFRTTGTEEGGGAVVDLLYER